jgi:hypothetical protein
MNRIAAMVVRHRWSLLAVFVILSVGIFSVSWWLTAYVESPSFREMISRQTSKGLKIEGEYKSVRRTGFLSASTPGFHGGGGEHTMKSLQAHEVEARFNPLGFFLKRWQFDRIEVRRGAVELQKVDGDDEDPPPPKKPWYHVFLPDRIYLKKTHCPSTDVLWMFKEKRAGIYDIDLIIRPNGRDFEYWGKDGILRMPFVPQLRVERIHTLIRKEKMYLYGATLVPPGKSPRGTLEVHGEAGLKKDRTITTELHFQDMPLPPWLPKSWQPHVDGLASGEIDWRSVGTKIENSNAGGRLDVAGGRLYGLKGLQTLATFTENPRFLDIRFDDFGMDLAWRYPKLRAKRVRIEAKGLVKIQGSFQVINKALDGEIQLGVTQESLKNFPGAEEKIFTRQAGGYLWTAVKLSGTVSEPKEDLSPRLTALLWESPGAFFSTLFRMLGDWFKGLFE